MNVTCKFLKLIRVLSFACFFLINSFNGAAQLVADFTADKTGGCSPLPVSFINQTTGASANATYSWDFGNANTSSNINAGAIFKDEKTYSVTLTVKDGNLSSSKTKQITVYAPPSLDFTASPIKGCLPVQADFTANADGGNAAINSYTWDFGDGNIQQGASASQSHVYSLAQKATVSLTVSNNFGCTKTLVKQNVITILPSINAAFTASQTILCRVSDPVQFTNTSSGPGILSYLWEFGDGAVSTLATPSHVFNVKGIYTVKLTVNSSEGCSAVSIQNGYINVASFKTDFSVPALICNSNNYTNFDNTSSPFPTSSLWNLNGVDQYYNYGTLSASFPVSGTAVIKLTNYFGTCNDSAIKSIVIKQSPEPQGFTSVINGECGAPLVCNFKDTAAGNVKWEWNFKADYYYYDSVYSRLQAPDFNYESDGSYTVRLKVENAAGCSAITQKTISIVRPYVYINREGSYSLCGPVELKFTGLLFPVTDSILTYNWAFGDGAVSTEIIPTHVFSSPGTYGITLSYTTRSGCTGLVSGGTVTVNPVPKAIFSASATNVCGQSYVAFTAVPQGGTFNYDWDFGDGNPLTNTYNQTEVYHQYAIDSIYTVRLIVSYFGYCADTLIKTNLIKVNAPFPHITGHTNTCDGNRGIVSFTQATIKSNQLTWDFGDGSFLQTDSTKKTVGHQYNQSKNYFVKLTAVNGACTYSDSIYVSVHLKQTPLLTLEKTDVCTEDVVKVTITQYDRNPTLDLITKNYSFNFYYGDGAPFNGQVRDDSYYYLWSNEYLGTITGFDKAKKDLRVITRSYNFNCLDTSNYVPLKVRGSFAGFEVVADNSCFKSAVILKDTSKTNSKITSWQWSFGDGSRQTFNTGGTISHSYANPGQYNVTLNIIDSSGCSSNSNSQYQYVNVNGPRAVFSTSSTNTFITLPVYFYNYTNNYNSYNTVYNWSFGDGGTSTDYSPNHSYSLPGQYMVRLIAKNPTTSCTDTSVQVVVVNNFNPAFAYTSSFLAAGNCPPVLVRLSNNSINYTSVKWNFGDGITADNINYPAHVYEKPGKYFITLYVYGPGGLTGTYLDSITILQPTASLKVDKKLGCIGLVATIKGSIKSATSFTWDFGDGSLLSNKDTIVSHQYNIPGIYQPALLLIDTNGCSSFLSLNESISIRKNPVITITPAAPLLCRGQSVVLNASGGITYIWSPAKALSNTGIAAPNASPDSNTLYRLTVKDDIGCSNKDSILVTVVQKQKVKVSVDTAVCLGKNVQLIASGANTYDWINNTAGLSNTTIPNPVATPLVNTTFTVSGSDAYKCFSDTARVTVLVLPLPTVSIAPVQDILLGSPISLLSNYSNDVVLWRWSPADYLSCINCAAPVSTPLAAITYLLEVKNNVGCTDTAEITLKLQCQESRVFIPAAFSPNNDGNNDLFSIKGISIVKHMIIFNRWGKPVYERSNYIASDRNNGWDGTYKGDLVPAGAYTYFAEMECPSGGIFVRKGTVMLIR